MSNLFVGFLENFRHENFILKLTDLYQLPDMKSSIKEKIKKLLLLSRII